MTSQKPAKNSLVVSEIDKEGIFAKMKLGIRSHFLDSGSFSLWTLAAKWGTLKGKDPYLYYKTKSFYQYMDAYASFIKEHKHAIDYYANVDAIPNPEVSYTNQRYLEDKHGLTPVPVVHYRTDLKWLQKYIDRGHKFIALGGLVGSTDQEACRHWLDKAFAMVCNQPSKLPIVKIHGFGVTSFPLLLRYPWYSVDSTTWTLVGAMGGILVPWRRDGKWVFRTKDGKFPFVVKFSDKAKDKNIAGKHFNTLKEGQREVVLAWLKEIAIPLGKNGPKNEILSYGVTNRHCERKAANLLFFERLRHTLPKYPWAFGGVRKTTLGIKSC